MALTTIGDLAQSFILRRQTVSLKADLERLTTEVTTGLAPDPSRAVAGDFSVLASIEASLGRLDGYRSTTAEASVLTESMQAALSTIDGLASDFGPTLLTAANSGHPTMVSSAATDGAQKFRTTVAALNARVGDRSLFAGVATESPAVLDADAFLSLLDGVISGAGDAAAVQDALTAWFDDPGGFVATAVVGGDPLQPLAIASGETARMDVTAADPQVRDTLKGLAMVALLDRGALAGDATERAVLARLAGETLMAGQTGRAQLAARVGTVQGQIEAASVRNQTERASLEIARVGVLASDPFEAATALQTAQTQLEMLYTITARITRLSLVDYL